MKEWKFVSARRRNQHASRVRSPEFAAEVAASTRRRQGYGVPSSQGSAAFLMLFGTLEEFSIRA